MLEWQSNNLNDGSTNAVVSRINFLSTNHNFDCPSRICSEWRCVCRVRRVCRVTLEAWTGLRSSSGSDLAADPRGTQAPLSYAWQSSAGFKLGPGGPKARKVLYANWRCLVGPYAGAATIPPLQRVENISSLVHLSWTFWTHSVTISSLHKVDMQLDCVLTFTFPFEVLYLQYYLTS